MADSLPDRIRRGDFDAFEDPSLPLYLLAEPDAVWWWEGVEKVACRLQEQLVHYKVPPADACTRTPENLRKLAMSHLSGVRALATGMELWPDDVQRMLPLLEAWIPSLGRPR